MRILFTAVVSTAQVRIPVHQYLFSLFRLELIIERNFKNSENFPCFKSKIVSYRLLGILVTFFVEFLILCFLVFLNLFLFWIGHEILPRCLTLFSIWHYKFAYFWAQKTCQKFFRSDKGHQTSVQTLVVGYSAQFPRHH